MWSPRHVVTTLFLCLLALTALFGCRAFEPEAVVVNRTPDTYIIGSPAETSGAYFHYHVYWYGTDADGFVERFVWALTDTSIQDIETDEDEEDENFNPATNVNTLEIAHWTTRTDSIFDFRIDQGANLSADMTLHMVAVDDRGAFDRTPARLHFFSNALGHPEIRFRRFSEGQGGLIEFANEDTIGYGEPLLLEWSGTTPNIAYYADELLEMRDTIPEDRPPGVEPDGLLGFKWRLPAESGCDDSREDCWNPKVFNEATGDSESYFGDITSLNFLNDGSGPGPFNRVLSSGVLQILVNTVDMAGVEIPSTEQALDVVVNYDPDTYLLRYEDDSAHGDPQIYPYYEVFYGDSAGIYPFDPTDDIPDTIPDRAKVVFKALGWDDPRDEVADPDNENLLQFQGRYIARQTFLEGGPFTFFPTFSDTHRTEEWTPIGEPKGVAADTLSFLVGPFDYDFVMRSVDELGRRDGTPDTISFTANYPPCIQCIELTNTRQQLNPPQTTYEDDCWESECLDETTTLYLRSAAEIDPSDPQDLTGLSPANPAPTFGWLSFNVENSGLAIGDAMSEQEGFVSVPAYRYEMMVYLVGKDHPKEYWEPGKAHQRIDAWRYQIDYEADLTNSLRDTVGGSVDDILARIGTGFDVSQNDTTNGLFIKRSGVWGMEIVAAVPALLQSNGPNAYWLDMLSRFAAPPDTFATCDQWANHPNTQRALRGWQLSLVQLSPATIRAIAMDISRCEYRFQTNMYHYYDGVRVPPIHGRRCEPGAYDIPGDVQEAGALDLRFFASESLSDGGEPVTKPFQLEAFYGGLEPGSLTWGDPPSWPCPPEGWE